MTLTTVFSAEKFGKTDLALAAALLLACFALFFHNDIRSMGLDSLNYLFGTPLEFYENCKRIHGGGRNMLGTPYPPPVYVIFALWLYPLKLFGVITGPENFPPYLVYWLKTLTALVYVASGFVFYRIVLEYSVTRQKAKYFTAAWLTTPLALFPQFIFAQMDIFYVFLTLSGFLMFLRRRLYWAAIFFGLAISFKYFPLFAFLPLLLLYEKSLSRIALCCLFVALPTLLINLLYGTSPAFIEGVRNHFALSLVFAAWLYLGGWHVYLLFGAVTILCGIAFFADVPEQTLPRTAAYVWLIASIAPFIFIVWHPQWAISFAPAIVLTSMLSDKTEKFMLLDLAGMFFFVAVLALGLQHDSDAEIFQGKLLGLDFENSYLMANLFRWFGDHSLYLFLSGFWAYLVLQVVLKFRPLVAAAPPPASPPVNYGLIRQRLYVGLLIYLLPAAFAIYEDLTRNVFFVGNKVASEPFGQLLKSRTFEQTFVAKGTAISKVSLLLTTFGRQNSSDVRLEILDSQDRTLAKLTDSVWGYFDNSWHDFNVGTVPVSRDSLYKIRLTSSNGTNENAIGWYASTNTYPAGQAIVDHIPREADFTFLVTLAK